MNKVILMGRTTKDSEVRYGANGKAFARFSLAVNRGFKKESEEEAVDFISCVAFDKTAEFMEKYGTKGKKFVLEGRIHTGSYTNKDGVKVYTFDVIADNMEFAESRKHNGASENDAVTTDDDGFMMIPDAIGDDIPFS